MHSPRIENGPEVARTCVPPLSSLVVTGIVRTVETVAALAAEFTWPSVASLMSTPVRELLKTSRPKSDPLATSRVFSDPLATSMLLMVLL